MRLADCTCSSNLHLGTAHWVVNNAVKYGEDSDIEILIC